MDIKEEVTGTESSSILAPVLISGAIGAGLALLLAPKSGRDIRSDLGRFVKKTGEQATAAVEEGKAAVSEAVQTGQESLAEAQERANLSANGNRRSLVVPILVSSVVGAAIALLFAPKPGKEVMEDIKDMAASAAEKSKDLYQKGATAVKEAWEKGKEAAATEEKEKMRPAA